MPRPPTSPRWCSESSVPSRGSSATATVDRPASYRDITVLIRSRTRLGVLEHTLRKAGVPYRVEGGTLIYGSREVYELLRVLRAVDDPTNQLKVVTALRTSIFGIDDRQLLRVPARRGVRDRAASAREFRVYSKEPGPVGDALRTLEQFGRRKHERTPAELLAELYDGWRGVAAALVEGEQVARETWRRVRYVIDEARAWSDATGGTLAEYLAWVDRRIDDVDRVELSTDEGEDSRAHHDHARREGSRVPDHGRRRARRGRRHQCRHRACDGRPARRSFGSAG